jgi:DNA-binding MarR family transcriptional regulator
MPGRVHLYRPQRTEVEVLEAISVAREPLLRDILGRMERWEPGSSRQHYLLIGPRGIGKTHLLRVIEHRLRHQPELRSRWVPAVLAEDFYGVANIGDLLLEVLRVVAEATEVEILEETYRSIRFEDDDAKVCDRCLDAFRAHLEQTGRGVVLMVENFDRLLERQLKKQKEVRRLRRILIEEEWLVALCTSPTYLNAVMEPAEPFFEFFRVQLLAELTQDQQQEMFWKLADADAAAGAAAAVAELRAEASRWSSRLRALYHFTGGNPRLTVMLYDLVAHRQITAVRNELDLLLDQLTPFYQDRMKEVSEQEAKVLEAMALMTEGCNPTELAKATRMLARTVRAVLSRLEKGGYVQREERRRKQTIYVIPERFFRIWHQMNHSRAARGRVKYLLEFFASWYATREERDRIWDELTEELEAELEEVGEREKGMEVADQKLRASFEARRLDLAREVVECMTAEAGDLWFWAPHMVALEYLESDRDPAILERQQPEMREAVQLLVDCYDAGGPDADTAG